jgi:ubiquinone/menaquinone biosynthesis C-methylase UbiE
MIAGTMRQDLYPELSQVENNHWWHRQKRRLVHQLIKRSFLKPGKALDVGCGGGKMLLELKNLGWQSEGIDSILAEGRKRGLNIKKIDLQNQRLPYPNNFFDLIICLDTLEHIHNDKRLVKEMARVVKKGGSIIISVPAYQWLFSYWDRMLGHFRRYSESNLSATLPKKTVKIKLLSYYFSYLLLPAIFVRAVKIIFRRQTSDFTANPLPTLTYSLVDLLGTLEFTWLKYSKIPFGLSIICVTEKR